MINWLWGIINFIAHFIQIRQHDRERAFRLVKLAQEDSPKLAECKILIRVNFRYTPLEIKEYTIHSDRIVWAAKECGCNQPICSLMLKFMDDHNKLVAKIPIYLDGRKDDSMRLSYTLTFDTMLKKCDNLPEEMTFG